MPLATVLILHENNYTMKKIILLLASFLTVKTFAQFSIQHVKTAGNNVAANMAVLNSTLFLQIEDATAGIELYTSDGTTAGTILLKDIVPGSGDSNPRFFQSALGKILFRAGASPFVDSLYITDGTAAGTKALCKLSLMSTPTSGTEMGGKYYFINGTSTTGDELWVTDGTLAGTQLVKDIASGTSASNIEYLVTLNNKIYFKANDNVTGDELWTSDGSSVGTTLLKDIYTGAQSSGTRGLTVFNNKIYFGASDGTNGNELWVSDGTAAGTTMLKDILPGTNSGSSPFGFTIFNNKLYFAAEGPSIANELYETDGTTGGTNLTADIDAGTLSSLPQGLITIGNNLFMTAKLTNSSGYELMAYSPTTNSVNLMADAFPGTTSGFQSVVNALGESNIAPMSSMAVITAKEANNLNNIWVSNGTSGGTAKITYTAATYTTATQQYLTPFNGNVYFFAKYGTSTKSLYKLTSGITAVDSKQKNTAVDVMMYPVPCQSEVTLEFNRAGNFSSIITIYNTRGEQVYETYTDQQKVIIPLKNLSAGIYLIQMKTNTGICRKKIIIE